MDASNPGDPQNMPIWPIYAGPWAYGPYGLWPYGWPMPAVSNCPPSPEPPWARRQKSPLAQTITIAGNVSLTQDPTLLVQQLNTPSVPVAISIPNGNWRGQTKVIMIPANMLASTETWILSGTFSGFTTLQFDGVGASAMLMWDGSGWQFMGGNATVNP